MRHLLKPMRKCLCLAMIAGWACCAAGPGWAENATDAAPAEPLSIDDTLAEMSIEAKVAQVMLVTLHGVQNASYDEREFLTRYRPGGVLLAGTAQPISLTAYVSALRRPAPNATLPPLLVGTNLTALNRRDSRIDSAFVQVPTQLAIGATGRVDAAQSIAAIAADYLVPLGFNLHLGPTLALSPLISMDSVTQDTFGGDAHFAAQAGSAMVRTLLDRKILPAVMDFPGGTTGENTAQPDALVTSSTVLHTRYLAPYAAAIEAGAPLIHVSNVLVPGIDDADRPASLSKAVLHGLLREELMFQGVILAGPMDARNLARVENPIEASIQAIEAGADMLLWQGDVPVVMRVIPALIKAVELGRLPEDRLNDAVRRVLVLKEQAGLNALPLPDEKAAQRLDRNEKTREIVRTIERQSITLVKNEGNVLPLTKEASVPVGITGTVGVRDLYDPLQKKLKGVMEQPLSTAKHIGDIADFEIYRATSDAAGLRTAVCILGPGVRLRSQVQLVQAFKQKGARVVVVYLGHPANVPQLAEADAILLAYSNPTSCPETIEALKEILLGISPMGFAAPPAPLALTAGNAHAFAAADWLHAPAGRLPLDLGSGLPMGTHGSFDLTAVIEKAAWDFGDGEKAKGARVDHAYAAPGQYTVTLRAQGLTGETLEHAIPVTVQ